MSAYLGVTNAALLSPFQPIHIRPRRRESMALRDGALMKILFGAAAILLPCPAFAADVATCTLSAKKKTITVIASNRSDGDGLRHNATGDTWHGARGLGGGLGRAREDGLPVCPPPTRPGRRCGQGGLQKPK